MQPETEGLGLGFTPIGPTGRSAYLLGADGQGRDVAARLLYGGRNSLLISAAATVLCLTFAALLGVTAGFFGGAVDTVLNGLFDLLWAFPVYLLAISLSIAAVPEPPASGALKTVRVRLTGDLPSPASPPRGCRFHPRCPQAQSRCAEEAPPLRALSPARQVACHFPLI